MKERFLNDSLRILFIVAGIAVVRVFSDETFDNLVNSKRYAEALSYADANIPAKERDAKTWVKLGRANEGQALVEKALACYMFATRLDPNNFEAVLGMARIYNKFNQPENAAAAAKKALDLKFNSEASWEYGRACIALKKPADAKKAFEKVVENDPGNVSAQWELGLIYYNEKAYDKAIELLKSVYVKQPTEALALKIGQIYNEAGNVDSAIVYLKGPNNRRLSLAEAGLELARIYFKQQKYSEAADEFERGTTKSVADAMDLYFWAISLEKSGGNPDKLAKVYRLAVEGFGKSKSKEALQCRLKLGQGELDKKNYPAAVAQFQTIAAIDPDGKIVPENMLLLVSAYEGAGALDKAISCLEKIIRQNPSDVQAYGRLGDLYTKEGDIEKARVTYEKMISINPNDNKVQLLLGDYYLQGKKYQEALKYFQKSYTMERTSRAAEGMAIAAMALNKADMARDAAESAIRMDSTLWKSRLVLSHVYLKDRNYKDAIGQLEVVLKRDPNNKEIWQQLAQCYEKIKDPLKLSAADRRIIALDARNTASRLRLARYALSQNDTKTALDLFKELSALSPKDAEVFKNLYEISLGKDLKDDAIAYLKRYLTLRPGDAKAQKELGDLYYEKKMPDDALWAYRAALKADPSIKGLYSRYAEIILARESDPGEVISVISGAIAAGEANANMYAALGSSYHKRGECNKAIEMFQKSLQLDPRTIAILTPLAECQAKTGKAKEAIVTFEQAISMNTGAIQEYKALGDLYSNQGKPAQAIAMYKKYLGKKPGDDKVALSVAENLFAQKSYEDAVKYYDMVRGDEMKKAEFLFRFGQACYFSKNYRRAIELCKLVIDLAPQNADAYKMLFDMSSRDNTLKGDAAMYLKKYLALRPNDAPAQKSLADMLYEQKDFTGALSAYRQALKVDPSMKDIYKQYVELVMQRGTKEETVKAITGAIAAGEVDVNMYNALATLYQNQGNYARAIEMFQKSLQLDPKNLPALSSLAQCQAKKGDLQQAIISYEQLLSMNPSLSVEYKALGDLYMQQHKKDQAIASYKKYLEKNAADVACILAVADNEYKSKNFDEAIRFLEKVRGEETKKTSYLLLYGQACYQSKTCTKAATIFKQLATLMPSNPDVFKTLYDIAIKSNNSGEALAALKRYVAIKPTDALAQKQLGDLLYDQKDMPGALNAYAAAFKSDPSIRGIYKRYCEIAIGRLPQSQMAAILTAAVKANEADGAIYAALGSIYQKQNACNKAIPYFQKALQMNPKGTDIIASLAACQEKTGALGDAAVSYEQVVAMNPNAQSEYKALGDLYMKQNKSSQAIAMYRKYLEKSPNDYDAAAIVGENALKEKNYADAVKYLGVAQTTKGNNIEFLFSYGQACYYDALNQSKNFKKPIELLERMRAMAKRGVPHNAEVLKILANCYDQIGDTARAMAMYIGYTKLPGVRDQEASFRKAQLTEPSNPSLAAKMHEDNTKLFPKDYRNFLYAGLYYAKRPATYDKAVSLLKKCSALADSIPVVWMELGQIYGKLGKNNEEVEAYRQFIQLDAGNPEAIGKIGEILLSKNNVNDAMVFLETANALKPNDPKFMPLLAQGYLQTDRPNEAITLLEKSEKLKPQDISIKEQLYTLYEKKGNSKNALKEIKQILEKKRDAKYLLKYAQMLYANGVYAEAENAVKDIRATDPENLTALMLMGKIQGIQGKWDDALETYKEISYIKPDFAPAIYERAEIHLMQSKLPWAKTFYERALKSDPKYILAVIGLAKVARIEKNKAVYVKQIQAAQKLDPKNKALLEEMHEGRKLLR